MIHAAALAFLAVITVVFCLLARGLWRRSNDVSILIGAFVIFMWTFAGAWLFVADSAVGFRGYHIGFTYYYLMQRMFPFVVDGTYLESLAYYAVFCVLIFLVMRLIMPRSSATNSGAVPVSREALVLGGLAMLVLSFMAVLPAMRAAVAEHRSAYSVLHEVTGWRHGLHALCNEAATAAVVLGSAISLSSGSPNALWKDTSHWMPRWGYAVALALVCLFLTAIGDRHALFGALVLAVIYLLNVEGKRAWKKVALLGGACMLALVAGGSLRGMAWTDKGLASTPSVVERFTLPAIKHVPRKIPTIPARIGEKIFINEFFCAHFSMYGILERGIAPETGVSFKYLASSFKAADQRPLTAYDHYATEGHLVEGQGYTIHHAAAWYLNFGTLGLLLGGAVTGALWSLAYRAGHDRKGITGAAARMLPWCFVAFLPALVRNGPEAYKALLFEGCIIPIGVVVAAAVVARLTRKARAI